MRSLNISDLNKRITFQSYTSTENDLGDSISTWINFKTVWASAQNLHGREFFQAMAVSAEKIIKFTIRYCKDIDESMRIIFNGKSYDIKAIDNIKYGNKFMEIQAMVVI